MLLELYYWVHFHTKMTDHVTILCILYVHSFKDKHVMTVILKRTSSYELHAHL